MLGIDFQESHSRHIDHTVAYLCHTVVGDKLKSRLSKIKYYFLDVKKKIERIEKIKKIIKRRINDKKQSKAQILTEEVS